MSNKSLPKDIEILLNKISNNKDIPYVDPTSKRMKLGYPVLFQYDAKFKNSLEFWDALPLSVVLARYPGSGFLGINLHYIPWTRRIQLATALVRRTKNKNRITYDIIKSAWGEAKLPMALAYLCIRRYLFSHMRSKPKQFDWETYRNIVKEIRPRFRKESEQQILNLIMQKYNNQKKRVK